MLNKKIRWVGAPNMEMNTSNPDSPIFIGTEVSLEGGICTLTPMLEIEAGLQSEGKAIKIPVTAFPEIMEAVIGVTGKFNLEPFRNWSGGVDVRGCKEYDGAIESDVPDPTFWGVYLQEKYEEEEDYGERWMWCVDFATEKQARSFADLLTLLQTITIPAK